MLFATLLVPNNVQHYPRPPTYDLPDLPPSSRQTFLLLPLLIAIQITTLAIIGPLPKSSPVRKLLPTIVIPILIGIAIQAVLFCHHLTSPVVNFSAGTAAICLTLQGIDLLYIIPSRYEIPLTDIFKFASRPVDSMNPTWRQRFDWAGACYNNPRMLKTPFEPSVLKRRRAYIEKLSCSQFLWRTVAKVMGIWLLIDALLAYCRYDLWFSSASHAFATPDTLLMGAMRTVLGASAIWMAVDSEHGLAALAMVGLAGDEYREWPDMFGFWTERWCTIAEFWTIAWHGLFRQQFVLLTHTVSSPLLRVFMPFLFSAVLHFSGAYMQARNGVDAAVFLIMQPVGILVQQALVGREVKGRFARVVVWSTTMTWLVATGYRFIKAYAQGGMFDIEPIPISFLSMFGIVEGPAWRWNGILHHVRS
ncbi:hypothetical protein ABW21_db0205930 [Orbilia brochopaga]|nr:hypothetical protein ABW21_db0205930 [Drechslerella brochopaga]